MELGFEEEMVRCIASSKHRGDAPHHSRDSEQDKAKKAEELWSTVVGGVGYAGFLTRFCLAFGLIMPRDALRGQSSDITE